MVRMHQGWTLYSKQAKSKIAKFQTLKAQILLIQNEYGHTGHQEKNFNIHECLWKDMFCA